MKKTNILFICKYNRFRSKVAETYFKKINKNKNIKVDSAGIIKGTPIDKKQKKVTKEFGLNISKTPKGISSNLLMKQNLIIVVANDIPRVIFDNKKYTKKLIIWKIADQKQNNEKAVKIIINKIIKKVDVLNKQLEKTK